MEITPDHELLIEIRDLLKEQNDLLKSINMQPPITTKAQPIKTPEDNFLQSIRKRCQELSMSGDLSFRERLKKELNINKLSDIKNEDLELAWKIVNNDKGDK